MGTWGTGLFDNDFANDVREDYLEKLRSGKTAEIASREMIESYLPAVEEEEALFWFALAATQWEYGRLQFNVR